MSHPLCSGWLHLLWLMITFFFIIIFLIFFISHHFYYLFEKKMDRNSTFKIFKIRALN
jgi:hypothetical protein